MITIYYIIDIVFGGFNKNISGVIWNDFPFKGKLFSCTITHSLDLKYLSIKWIYITKMRDRKQMMKLFIISHLSLTIARVPHTTH